MRKHSSFICKPDTILHLKHKHLQFLVSVGSWSLCVQMRKITHIQKESKGVQSLAAEREKELGFVGSELLCNYKPLSTLKKQQ